MTTRRLNLSAVEDVTIIAITGDDRNAAKKWYPKLIPLIKDFNKDQLRYFKGAFGVNTDDWSPTESWFLGGLDNGFYLIPVVNDKPVGMLNGVFSTDGGVKYLDINTVYVAPSHQRQGIARAMFLKAKEIGAGSNVIFLSVYANNPAAIKFYESVGLRAARISMVGNM